MVSEAGAPLVPILRSTGAPLDPETLESWYFALSTAISSELPHDLLAVWVYPASGGAALIAPAALADDHLTVPTPPDVSPRRLELLEEIIRDAGYPSAMARAIRSDDRETGLLLFAALQPDIYRAREHAAADAVAEQLAPMFARVARRWGLDPGEGGSAAREAAIVSVAAVVASATTAHGLATDLRQALGRYLAADRLELLVPGASTEQWYRLGEHPGGPLWSDPDLVLGRADLDVTALFGAGDMLLREDARPGSAFPGQADGAIMRSILGVRLGVAGRTAGCILLGSTEPHRYAEPDLELLRAVAPLVAIRTEALVAAGHLQIVRSHLATLRSVPAHLGRLAEMLASTSDSAEATRRFAVEVNAVLVFERLHFALRLTEDDRVAIVGPGETRPLPDLPLTPITGTGLGRVVRGEVPNLTVRAERRADLIVSLRVAGQVIGAMVLTGGDAGMFGQADVEMAQQLADLIAPHLELVRRGAIAPPMMPGWKRAPKF
ncbi:MAG: GAF domain-containing protein [Gemmatimonadales bacterium]|nr:GAF domain-containing protein [Gemmatimonadales bacterium]